MSVPSQKAARVSIRSFTRHEDLLIDIGLVGLASCHKGTMGSEPRTIALLLS